MCGIVLSESVVFLQLHTSATIRKFLVRSFHGRECTDGNGSTRHIASRRAGGWGRKCADKVMNKTLGNS